MQLGTLLLTALVVAFVQEPPMPYKITARRADDVVDVRLEKDTALFSFKSPFGISGATIERTGESWPAAVVVRLRLKGLENFKIAHDKGSLGAAVSADRTRVWKDGKEDAPLDEKSPLWLNVRMLNAEGKATRAIPLPKGYYFEMTVPKAFLEGNPKTLTLSWIDFYRN